MARSQQEHDRSRSTWKCPKCGRAFAKTNQAHSCKSTSVASHFKGKNPELRELFDSLLAALRSAGPVHIDAVASSINLVSRHHFGGAKVRGNHQMTHSS